MLVLSRKQGEAILIGKDITIVIVKSGENVYLGIDAPKSVPIVRTELLEAINTMVATPTILA